MSPSIIEFSEDRQLPPASESYEYVLSSEGAAFMNENFTHPGFVFQNEFEEGDVLIWPPSSEKGQAFNQIKDEDFVYLGHFGKVGQEAVYRVNRSADLFSERRVGGEREG